MRALFLISGAALSLAPPLTFAASAQDYPDKVFEGKSEYSPRMQQFLGRTVFTRCDSARISQTGDRVTITFYTEAWGEMVRYRVSVEDDVLRVLSAKGRRDEGYVAAEGSCELIRKQSRISTITCIADFGHKTIAANLVVRRR